MPEINDGDSKAPSSYEFKDGKMQETEDTIGATTNESHATEESEKANSQPDDVLLKDTTGKAEKELHHNALDLIGTVLADDYKGDKKQFFESHPDLAAKADKSKKYKDEYRKLIVSDKSLKVDDDVIDEETLAERVYTKVTEKSLSSQHKEQAKKYAVKEGLNMDEFDSFSSAADAMHKATGIDYAQCLEGAKTALKGRLSKEPLKMPSGSGIAKEDNKEAEVQKIMKEHGVDKKTAEKFMNSRGSYNGELDKWTAL